MIRDLSGTKRRHRDSNDSHITHVQKHHIKMDCICYINFEHMDFCLFNISPALLFPGKKRSNFPLNWRNFGSISSQKSIRAQLNIFLIKREGGRRAAVD